MSVQQDTVDVIVGLGGDILDEELNLIDQVLVLSLSGRGALLGLRVSLASVLSISWLNLGNVEAGSEGSLTVVLLMEEIVESGNWERLMLLVDLSENNWGKRVLGVLDLSLLFSLVITDLAGNTVGELGGADESHDVRVVLEDQDLFGGGSLVIGGRSDLDDGALFEVGELNP
jgi:hypothetical protein